MKKIIRIAPAMKASMAIIVSFLLTSAPNNASAQAITSIITDYNGFWKSSTNSVNAIKPDNSHNLLAFTYNNVSYSTGVNDYVLASHNESFVQGDFWALPVNTMTGTISSNTKVGLGAMYDSVFNGASNPTPAWGISKYLTDGVKGLDLGTCIANLPVGSMTFLVANIQAAAIGDGVPDVLVTQIADPTGGSYDRYEFVDANGVRVGSYKDIVFTNITPVGNWTADFYEAVNNPLTLQGGFTQTDRPLRLWAADLSEFGITAANLSQVKNFKINLCGNSDVAFVGYNNKSIVFQYPLPVRFGRVTGALENGKSRLAWQALSEAEADKYVIEKSIDGKNFKDIASVPAKNEANSSYTFTDAESFSGDAYYRIKQIDLNGKVATYSIIIKISNEAKSQVNVYPNPTHGAIRVVYPQTGSAASITLYNAAGQPVHTIAVAKYTNHTVVDLSRLHTGAYLLVMESKEGRMSRQLLVQ